MRLRLRLFMKSAPLSLLSFVVALPALASCDPSLDLIHVKPGCPEMPLRGPDEFAAAPPERMIDDFENDGLSLPAIGGRDGAWMGSLGPMPIPGAMIAGAPSDECVARGTHSAHLTSIANTLYAASWTAVLMNQTLKPTSFDAADTVPAFGNCLTCNDYYAIKTRIPLTKTWTRWFVRFSDLAQYGFGNPLVPLRKDQLVAIIIWPESQFDIWIDDLRFEP
jgi:hypothetical protein